MPLATKVLMGHRPTDNHHSSDVEEARGREKDHQQGVDDTT